MDRLKDTTKKVAVKAKNHVASHKFAYASLTVAVLAIWLQQSNRKAFYQFLIEKGIDPQEYYCPEALAEGVRF